MKKRTGRYRNRIAVNGQMNSKPGFRLVIIGFFSVVFFLVIFVKLVKVQVLEHDRYRDLAKKNIQSRQVVPAMRGTIYDRQGRELAKDVIQYKVAIRQQSCKNSQKVIHQVSGILGIPVAEIKKKVRQNPKFALISKRVSPEKAKQLKGVGDPGIDLEKRFLRVYPYKKNGAHFIGYCSVDNSALGGIEYQYNHYLQGKPGWKIYRRDARGGQSLNLDYSGADPIDGMNVKLTIDMDYQEILSDELRDAVEKNKAREGVAVLVNAQTGAILGLSNYPQFDPNIPDQYSDYQRRNKAVTDFIEPGSTMKIVALSSALENLNVDLDNTIINCENGRYRLRGRNILDHKKYGKLSLRKVIENSSNIGTIKLVKNLDRRIFYRYLRNFGFGMMSGVDLPGESPGMLESLDKFSAVSESYMSIGYEIGVTPLQLTMAYSAIANGGKLLKPFIAQEVFDTGQTIILRNKPQTIRQVISPETAAQITGTLIGVVNHGTGKKAYLKEMPVAGKTGTSQLYDSEKGRYDNSRHTASFVGFFPAKNPHFTLLLVIKEPKTSPYGGAVSAPAFKNMAERICSISNLQVEPDEESLPRADSDKEKSIPQVKDLNVETAKIILANQGIKMKILGSGNKVKKQEEVIKDGKLEEIRLFTENTGSGNKLVMPPLKGLSLKEALLVLAEFRIVPSVEGNGVVIRQTPTAGVKMSDRKTVKLICKPA